MRVIYFFTVHFRRNLYFACVEIAGNDGHNLLAAQDVEYVSILIGLVAIGIAAVGPAVDAGFPGESITQVVIVAVFFLKAAVEVLILFNLPTSSIGIIKLLHLPLAGNIFFVRQFVIRQHQAGNITFQAQSVLIPRVACGTLPLQFDIAPFEVLIAHARLYVQAGSRFPIEYQVRAPFALFRRLRAGQARHAGHDAVEVHNVVAVGGLGALFQRFALVVGGKGEAEFVGKAEAVAEVEAVADNLGALLVAVDYGVVGMFYAVAFLIELLFELREGGWVACEIVGNVGVDLIIAGIDSVVAA